LSTLEDCSTADIAAMCDVPEATVRTRLHHARRKLRAALTGKARPRARSIVALCFAAVVLVALAQPRAFAAQIAWVWHAMFGPPKTSIMAPQAPSPLPARVESVPVRVELAPLTPTETAPTKTAVSNPGENRGRKNALQGSDQNPARPLSPQMDPDYARAHDAQFARHDYRAALEAWNVYLAKPNPILEIEARYNRAIALAELGQVKEAREAIAPFAEGKYGGYKEDSAARLLRALPQ